MKKMKLYDQTIFLPAVSIATHVACVKNDYRINDRKHLSSRFYLKNHPDGDIPFIEHPFLLTSAGHNYKNPDFCKQIGINSMDDDVEMMFGDSGGFQISSGAIKSCGDDTAKDIYKWLHNNSNVAPIIDCPPHATGSSDRNLDTFGKCINDTKHNIDVLVNSDNFGKTHWLNVIHGTTYDHRMKWYNGIKDYDFHSGWALGSLQKNYYVILTAFATIWDNKILEDEKHSQLIHFFGTSSLKFIPIIIYLKHKIKKMGYKTNISFDSSYATRDCAYGKMLIMMPNSKGLTSYHLSNKLIGKFNPDAGLPSINPVCKGLKLGDILNPDALRAVSGYQFYNVIQNHNIYVLVDFFTKMQNIIDTDCPYLWESAFKTEQLRVFKIIDKMFDAPQGKAHEILDAYAGALGKSAEPSSSDNIDDLFE